jgi:hypothetical protein
VRLALPHQASAVVYGVDRSTISTAIRQIRHDASVTLKMRSLLLLGTLSFSP